MMYSFSPNFYLIVLRCLPAKRKLPQYHSTMFKWSTFGDPVPTFLHRSGHNLAGEAIPGLPTKKTRTVNYGASSLQNDLLHVKRLQLNFVGPNLAPRIEMGVFGRSSTLLKYSNVTCTVIAALKALLKLYILRQLQSS